MKDYLLDESGDLVITENGDVVLTDSVRQAIRIRLKWFFGEWRFRPDYGVPYYEEILIKNPNPLRIKQLIRDAVMEVEEVTDVTDIRLAIDKAKRKAAVRFTAATVEETYREEVEINV